MFDARALWASRAVGAQILRVALLPVAGVFRTLVAMRNGLYDARVFRAHSLGAPSVSVGNLTVGGTGKTPFAHWIAAELASRGATPAVLLRGYGRDEVDVHQLLAPGRIVVANPDRVQAAREALSRGADVLVLDDAFQHRRVARTADIVLVSADADGWSPWPLPAGPWREPVHAARRARAVFVTVKAAADLDVKRTLERVWSAAPNVPTGVVRIQPDGVSVWGGDHRRALPDLSGHRVLAVSAIGDPAAFVGQLTAAGLNATPATYPDHYRYTPADVASLAAQAAGVGEVICTLKDAVKLGPVWPPGAPPLWYLSQRLRVERGADAVTALVSELLSARLVSRPS